MEYDHSEVSDTLLDFIRSKPKNQRLENTLRLLKCKKAVFIAFKKQNIIKQRILVGNQLIMKAFISTVIKQVNEAGDLKRNTLFEIA